MSRSGLCWSMASIASRLSLTLLSLLLPATLPLPTLEPEASPVLAERCLLAPRFTECSTSFTSSGRGTSELNVFSAGSGGREGMKCTCEATCRTLPSDMELVRSSFTH
jgi:hypothetical protein